MQYLNRYENENSEENEEEIDANKKQDKNIKAENKNEQINGINLYSEVKDSIDNEKEEEQKIYEFNNNSNKKPKEKGSKDISKKNKKGNLDSISNDDNNNPDKNSNKEKKKGQFDEYEYESQPKYKIPIPGELIFNPKKSKRKSYHPLFTKYEILEFNNSKRFSAIPPPNDSVFKMAVEIFPSKYGFGMPYRSQLRQSNYSVYSSRSVDKSKRKRTVSEKRKKTEIRSNDEASIKEFDFNAKSEHFMLKRYGRQNYFTYRSKIRSDNPFVGISHYSKNKKQRRNLIAKAVKKEGNQFNEIISWEENIIKKKILTKAN